MAKECFVYIGTYTGDRSEGIYLYSMNLSSGVLKHAATVSGVTNPSFLDIEPNCRYLYSVSEVGEFAGKPSGAVSAFAVDLQTGELTPLNQQPSYGTGPCYLSVDQTGKWVLVANYGSGSAAILPIQDDGCLGEATDVVQHQGSNVDPRRGGPRAHSITLDPANRYAFVADLGLDKIMIYRLDLVQGKLIPNDEPWAPVKPGAGPRHFAFHPNSKYAYVINELDNTVTAFAYDSPRGTLKEIQVVSTLPGDFTGTSYCADIHIVPSGKFLYGSNRGHDSIAVFAIDERTGKLTCVGHEPTQGKTPRNFAIDPTGAFLLAANQGTDNIVVFRIDQQTGKLAPTGHMVEVPMPVCVKMVPIADSFVKTMTST